MLADHRSALMSVSWEGGPGTRTYSVHVYANDTRAQIGCTCRVDAWLVRADGRRQERSALELVVLRL
jgi:hypothetical protein